MYLEKLEIQGFKSFANKNVLVFPGMLNTTKRGLTAIVGPNGSGKSNVADSVRWVLGEQSMKTLRGKKSEDIIFSGSDKRGKLGMSEVSLFLNNEDGQGAIDYSQVVITRRLYRDGESEYILNGNKVRLSDIQILLAKSKFGQKTYSVIGQGMVEDFLNTSLSERKEFFDEATGVKQYQIKRDESLNKLRLSYENLSQAQMLLEEIEPRLKSLTRQVGRLHKRGELEAELKENQKKYYCQIWHELNDKHNEINQQFLELEKNKIKKDKERESLERELAKIQEQNGISSDFTVWQNKLNDYQQEKDLVNKKIAVIEAQTEVQMESNGQFDLSWLNNKKSQLTPDLERIKDEINEIINSLANEKQRQTVLEADKKIINDQISNQENLLLNFGVDNQDTESKEINIQLKELLEKIEDLEEETDPEKIKKLINYIRQELQLILSSLEKENNDNKYKEIQTKLLNLARQKEEITAKIHELNLIISAKQEKQNLLNKQRDNLLLDISNIQSKLNHYQDKLNGIKPANGEDMINLKESLGKIETKIIEIKGKIGNLSQEEERKRNRLFDLQRKIHEIQNELNSLSGKSSELKINAARYETRLEDLEVEIRQSFVDFREIRDMRLSESINLEDTREKINNFKKQLDLIGGIDPEIEKEYNETKERFDFLNGQTNDLLGAIKSLEEVVGELDETIKEQFDKEFKIISEKFEEYFKILFNGGHAKIIKVMESDLEKEEKNNNETANNGQPETSANKYLENLKRIKYLQKHSATGLAGIEIQATPPGKKINLISMLSGGERSLVAIAMICAIISSNPSPFVVLDEVDASLDEANSERLAKILDDLSHKTQFVVITHNRATMRRANILYGVTMQDDGVSKLLSIKLDEATSHISNK